MQLLQYMHNVSLRDTKGTLEMGHRVYITINSLCRSRQLVRTQ